MKKLLVAALAISGAGCSSGALQQRQSEVLSAQVRMTESYLLHHAQVSARPLCRLECPPQGCQVQALECSAPASEPRMPVLAMPEGSGQYWARTVESLGGQALGIMGAVAPLWAVGRVIRGISGPTTTTTTTNTSVGSNHGEGQLGDWTQTHAGVIGEGRIGGVDVDRSAIGSRIGGIDGSSIGNRLDLDASQRSSDWQQHTNTHTNTETTSSAWDRVLYGDGVIGDGQLGDWWQDQSESATDNSSRWSTWP